MAHLSAGGTAVLSVFLIMAIVCPLILIKFWGPKHGTYGRRGKRDWDDDDQYDRRRRKRGAHGAEGNKRRRRGRSEQQQQQQQRMEEGEVGNEMHTRYRPEGDWNSSAPAPATAPSQGSAPYSPRVQGGQMYAGAYGLPPPGHGTGLPLGRSEDNRGDYTALPTGIGAGPGTPPPATPAPRYTPGGYRAPSSQPHTPSGLRCASLPHLDEEQEHAAAVTGIGAAYVSASGPGPYGPPGGVASFQGVAPTSPPATGQSHSSWLRKSSNALGRPLELVIGPARSQPRSRYEEQLGGAGGGDDGGQVQQLREWKKGVPLRPLEAVVAHPGRAGEADYLPPHTSQAPFVPPSNSSQPGGSCFALPALAAAQPLFDPIPEQRTQGGQHSPPAPAPAPGDGPGAAPGAGGASAGT